VFFDVLANARVKAVGLGTVRAVVVGPVDAITTDETTVRHGHDRARPLSVR
jgi:hypothetical protein